MHSEAAEIAFFVLMGYLSGSFLSAYFIPKWIWHTDITIKSSDKNPGTANAFTQTGILCGILVLCIELLKGFLPVWMAGRYIDIYSTGFIPVMAAPVVGHAYSCFYNFRGGKAIAPAFGVLLGLYPEIRPVLLLAFFYILYSIVIRICPHWRRSIVTFASWCIAMAVFIKIKAITAAGALISAIVIHKHCKAERNAATIISENRAT